MPKYFYQCPKCGSSQIKKQKDDSLYDTIFKWLTYDYYCAACGYEWDSTNPNNGYDPSKPSDDDFDHINPGTLTM